MSNCVQFEFTGLDVSDSSHLQMCVQVYDWNRVGDDKLMGQVHITIEDMNRDDEYHWYPLQPCEGMDDPEGEVRLSSRFYPTFPEPKAKAKSAAAVGLFGEPVSTGADAGSAEIQQLVRARDEDAARITTLQKKLDSVQESQEVMKAQMTTMISMMSKMSSSD